MDRVDRLINGLEQMRTIHNQLFNDMDSDDLAYNFQIDWPQEYRILRNALTQVKLYGHSITRPS